MKRKIILVIILVILIGGSLGSGYFLGYHKKTCPVCTPLEKPCPYCKPEKLDFSLFWEAWTKLEENFVNKEKLDIQKMIYGAISGMVNSLGDPYTVFFNPEETKRFISDIEGSFEGIGAEVGIKKGQLTIVAPLEGAPAQKAGLRPEDKILKIGDVSTSDLTIDEAVGLMRGPKGTPVILTIFRNEWDQSKEITITRDTINVPSIKWELKKNNIAYIKLYQFSNNIGSDFENAAIQILQSPADRIILDLRGNAGGVLNGAGDVAGWFLKRGEIITIEDFGGKKEREEYKAEGNAKLLSYPIVVLINQGTASASEILAGALRDNRGIKLVGETSFGKGVVQGLEELSGGSTLKVTVANWLTPKGQSINEKGLDPDIKVEMTDKDYEEEKDPQLDKAIEIIKGF